MEKYNESELLRDIKRCTYDEDYDKALELTEQLEIHKIRNISSLCLLGEIYLKKERYDEAEDILSKAYDRAPKGRRLLDLLTTLYINKKDYVQAEYYYKEFISVASKDLHRYVLRYRLDQGKGERLSVLIHTLEQLKDYEYIEEWAYELARLYHEAGEDKKCVRECDEIMLWFGQGEYVDKAIELKCKITGEEVPERLIAKEEKVNAAGGTVGATYMFDSEGLLANSGLNTALNLEEFMEDATEAPEVDKTEEIPEEALRGIQADADNTAQAGDDAPQEASGVSGETNMDIELSDKDITASNDKEMISALFGEMLINSMEENTGKESAQEGSQEEELEDKENIQEDVIRPESIVERIQNNTRDRWTGSFAQISPAETEAVVAPLEEPPAESEDEDEILSDEHSSTDFGMFFEGTIEASTDTAEEEIQEAPVKADDEDEILTEDIPIPDTVLDIFATAADIRDVKNQLAKTFTKLESTLLDKEDILAPYDINFVVSGTDDSMKSQISIGIAKALNTYGICDKQKIVGAEAAQLNSMDFTAVFDKITGGCLIISGAGKLSAKSIEIISDYVNKPEQKVAIVLEDSQDNLDALWHQYKELRSKFLNVINIAKYDERELVTLAASYAKKRGYDISEEAQMVTLREIFEKRMLAGQDVGYEDVMSVVDEAVINLEKRNMKNLFMTVLDNAYKEASMFTLLPEDFS